MKKYTIDKLAQIIDTRAALKGGTITGVSTDSRSVRQGDCFFAIPGPSFDGHCFVGRALAEGAVCAVVNRKVTLPDIDEKYLLRVDDTVGALGRLAARYRTECPFRVIAITGSVGKTTTRHIIAHVLGGRYRVFQAPKNFNNQIGLPLTLLNACPEDEFVVAELGTNKPGEIAYLSRIAKPDMAVVTNIYPAHLEGFGSIEAIVREKLSIAEGLSSGGCLLINGDYENLVAAAHRRGLKFITFGLANSCEIHPSKSDWNHTGGRFTVDSTTISVPLGGRGNLENAFAAWAVCSNLGLTTKQFAEAVETLPPVPMRAETKRFGTITVIDDCYNANPGSVKNAIEMLSRTAAVQKQRTVFIFGDMAELGKRSENFHKELAPVIVKAAVRLVVAVGPLAAVAASTAKNMADYDLLIETFNDARSAADNLHKFIKDYDIILIKGSRTVALEKVVQELSRLFSEKVASVR